MKVSREGSYSAPTPGQILDALHALGAETIAVPGHEPSEADVPALLGYLAHELERAQALTVTPDTFERYFDAYADAVGEPQPGGGSVLGLQWMQFATMRTLRLRAEVERGMGTSPLTRCTVESLGAASAALAIIAQSHSSEDTPEAETRERFKSVKTGLQKARQAYEDTVRMMRKMGAKL
ncbi:hypothetical protein [Streptomyces sp. NPDC087300]|uniref:hypothetical protein n=1 Tax=Streptomyces sp. NPDC087300 TaxID=3365780 RepID=UPI00380FF402